jgi:phenylalanyl-tRNA synthetase beta subunit
MKSNVSLPKTPSLVKLSRSIEESFVRDFGFDQVETYPWVDKKSLEMFGVDFDNLYSLKNPIDTDKPYMRDDMDYVMINYVTKNCKFFDDFRMFDLGRIWSKKYDIKKENAKFANEFV